METVDPDGFASGTLESRGGNGGNGTRAGDATAVGHAIGGSAAMSVIARSGQWYGTSGNARADASSDATQAHRSSRSSASAYAPSGQADATATSRSRLDTGSMAEARTLGVSGQVQAQAEVQTGDGGTEAARVSAPTHGATVLQANASVSHWRQVGALQPLGAAPSEAQALAEVDGRPSASHVQDRLRGNRQVTGLLGTPGHDPLAIGAMRIDGAAALDGTQSFTAQTRHALTLADETPLSLGLLDFTGRDAGTPVSIAFSVADHGATLLSRSFASLALARAFFDDHALDLGTFDGSVDLTLNLAFDAVAGQGVGFNYLLVTGVVPEPATWLLWLAGLGVAAGAARRRRAREPVASPEAPARAGAWPA
ncbi:MAG: PEP-CTERM sorting domain-containing protein [Comamonadaceae bacterium]|nr:PEP-CTERM sorting domain-containing protein [Comamonadaceae bacterium]